MEWSDRYSVKVEYLDRQHKQIVAYITEAEELLERFKNGKEVTNAQISSLIDRLAEYTARHFQDEETIMKRHNLRNFDRHVEIHHNLLQQVGVLRGKLNEHGTELLPVLVKFLNDWLKTHILGIDMTYSGSIGSREAP